MYGGQVGGGEAGCGEEGGSFGDGGFGCFGCFGCFGSIGGCGVLCGVVRCGVLRCGVVRCGACCAVWCGAVRCVVVRTCVSKCHARGSEERLVPPPTCLSNHSGSCSGMSCSYCVECTSSRLRRTHTAARVSRPSGRCESRERRGRMVTRPSGRPQCLRERGKMGRARSRMTRYNVHPSLHVQEATPTRA